MLLLFFLMILVLQNYGLLLVPRKSNYLLDAKINIIRDLKKTVKMRLQNFQLSQSLKRIM